MKLKKSIPMYMSILMLIITGIVYNTIDVITINSIQSTNHNILKAVTDAILTHIIILIVLFYYLYTTIYNFKQYLIKQEFKRKLKLSYDKIVNTLEDKIKEFVNDQHHKSYEDKLKDAKESFDRDAKDYNNNYNNDCCGVTKDTIFPGFERVDNVLDNLLHITKFKNNKDYYNYLNGIYKEIGINSSNTNRWKEIWLNCKPDLKKQTTEDYLIWDRSIPNSIKDYVLGKIEKPIEE